MLICRRFAVLHGSFRQRHEKRVDIYKSASVACERFTRTRQTVCDPDRQAGRQVGTRKRVDIYKSGGYDL